MWILSPAIEIHVTPFPTSAKVLKYGHFLHPNQARWMGGQLLRLLIRSVSSCSSGGGRLCKMVRPDILTWWQPAWASQAGTDPEPRADWPEHQLDPRLQSWAQTFWASSHSLHGDAAVCECSRVEEENTFLAMQQFYSVLIHDLMNPRMC